MSAVINAPLWQQATALQKDFADAQPFKHVCIHEFLDADFYARIKQEFPHADAASMRSEFGDASLKHTVETIRELGPGFRQWERTLASKEFIEWLEQVTGIRGLIFDPSFEGAGTHNNLHGQSLDLHIDFNHHHATRLHRRLNLIVYLNDDWDPNWGGSIELHADAWNRSPDAFSVSYPPSGNVAVLFETNEHSWHGFREIELPEQERHRSRKSLTVYYYSKTRPSDECAPDHSTIYVPDWIPASVRPGEELTQEAYLELERVMTRRDHYLQRLYARETDLQERYSQALSVLQPIRKTLHRLGLLKLVRRILRRDG